MLSQETVDIKDRISMKVNFEKMTQKNTRTGWEKRVRCAIKGAKDTVKGAKDTVKGAKDTGG